MWNRVIRLKAVNIIIPKWLFLTPNVSAYLEFRTESHPSLGEHILDEGVREMRREPINPIIKMASNNLYFIKF